MFCKPQSAFTICLALLLSPSLLTVMAHGGNAIIPAGKEEFMPVVSRSLALKNQAHVLYERLDLENSGLGLDAFSYALSGYLNLLEKGKLQNPNTLTICDFSQSSKKKRLYIIDLKEMKILWNTYVAHGRKSGGEFAQSFSNAPKSHKSSLGFYITEQTYYGSHGLSLRINGLEKGINDMARARNIVIHGSDYVGDDFLESNPFTGRSFGCPAIPDEETTAIINTIKEGSCLFIYHPTKQYLTVSKILKS
ncbi:MAG: murein L,D-transpeptidase catalytic domain family protein [Chitinophagaceae bacterium]|nr:murein L,D-transpeptidase catalytic domain family protein [Chitinophagaceae bacterium]